MKQKDLLLIIVIIVISAVASFFVSKQIFSSPTKRQQKAEVVQEITSDFAPPDKKYFNKNSINPTKLITISQNSNNDPFSAASN